MRLLGSGLHVDKEHEFVEDFNRFDGIYPFWVLRNC
jgi:hypothetical protein